MTKNEVSAVKYEEIVIHPLLFQDDILNPAGNLEAAQVANMKMEDLIEDKLLDLNLDKCSYIIAGNKKARKKMEKEVEKKPLILCNTMMK